MQSSITHLFLQSCECAHAQQGLPGGVTAKVPICLVGSGWSWLMPGINNKGPYSFS